MRLDTFDKLNDYVKEYTAIWNYHDFPDSVVNNNEYSQMVCSFGNGEFKDFHDSENLIDDIKAYMISEKLKAGVLKTRVCATVKDSFTGEIINGVTRITKKNVYYKNSKFFTIIDSVKTVDSNGRPVSLYDCPVVEYKKDGDGFKYLLDFRLYSKKSHRSFFANPRIGHPSKVGFLKSSDGTKLVLGCQYYIANKELTASVKHSVNGPAFIKISKNIATGEEINNIVKYYIRDDELSYGDWKTNKTVLKSKMRILFG